MVSRLTDKAGDSIKNVGNLFYNVMKKYDSAIRHEGNREEHDPPRNKPNVPKHEL